MSRKFAASTAITLIVMTLGGLSLTACQKPGTPGGSKAAEVKAPPSPYAAIAAGKVDVDGGVVEVAARRAGIVEQVYVQEGDLVTKGQILARQEDEDTLLAVNNARASVNQAQSALALTQVQIRTAQREYDRLEKLAPTNFVAQQKLDQARDAIDSARATLEAQQAAVAVARSQLAQAEYQQDLTIIRAPMDGKIIRRYANPGAGASTLNVSTMFDLEPAIPHIIRSEIVESSIPDVKVGQEAEIIPEADPSKIYTGKVMRIAATFGARKLKSDGGNEASDERVVEVVVSADNTPFLIGQRVLVKFMKPGEKAGIKREEPKPATPAKT
ncbi:efflux RND transporter periplasmic adaptor subunit [Asticcacaulis taihuensis]|uniref:HlyD family secretion protein n=1 Tax=Asticcacaulis taihuensis TaxID=260084 RepID=A0A1G4QGG6_9CAUL|nr:efflux RND transporter periplasmic adaptor subunit [Asticcacaulis taihuensis]SCW43438.1 HlyD family secretion protein [Asticcacaulis taihuensis]